METKIPPLTREKLDEFARERGHFHLRVLSKCHRVDPHVIYCTQTGVLHFLCGKCERLLFHIAVAPEAMTGWSSLLQELGPESHQKMSRSARHHHQRSSPLPRTLRKKRHARR